ncbi:addiction module protein [Luteolibacter sp. Y139]|uniref:Addiction module protein n=2 Tax=Luteolibacter soli TaxID=3135280 RepID=A0ABU9B165_9BACT
MEEIESQAMRLPESERATLAGRLLESLPAVLFEEDLGVAEAMRRDEEMDRDPSAGITLEELKASLGR